MDWFTSGRGAQWRQQVLRTMALVGSALFFLYALRSIPQAEATAMVFASPLFVMLLARVVLGERADLQRWLLALFGLLGQTRLLAANGLKNQVSALLTLIAVALYAWGGLIAWR